MGKHLVEKMEIFKGNSKREIHKKIQLVTNEPYKITDERVTKLGIFKKQYEVTAVIMSEVAIADGRMDFQETFQKSVVKTRPKTDDLLKKGKITGNACCGSGTSAIDAAFRRTENTRRRIIINASRTSGIKSRACSENARGA